MRKKHLIILTSTFITLSIVTLFMILPYYLHSDIIKGQYNASRPMSAADPPININGDGDIPTYATQGNGSESNPYIIENYNIGTKLEIGDGAGFGIYIGYTTKHLIIRNCYVHWGILIKSSVNVTIYGNTINLESDTSDYGILTQGATRNCTISHNTISNFDHGIYLDHSDRMVIEYNEIYNNDAFGIKVSGLWEDTLYGTPSYGNVIRHNIFHDNGISTSTNPTTASSVVLFYTYKAYIYNNTFDRSYESSIHVYECTQDIYIHDNTITNIIPNGYRVMSSGIDVYNSEDVFIYRNIISNSTYENARGIEASNSHVSIYDNIIYNTTYALYFGQTSNSIVRNNTLVHNNIGLQLFVGSNYNTVELNTFTNSTIRAVHMYSSSHNIFSKNIFVNNAGTTIFIASSQSNLFYLNIFGNNEKNVEYYDAPSGDSWNSSTAGNTWGDYTLRYPLAKNEGGEWSTPYEVSPYGVYDYHPLVKNYSYPTARFKTDSLLVLPNVTARFLYVGYASKEPMSFQWNFENDPVNKTEENPTYVFNSTGTYRVSLTVTDADGHVATYTEYIRVENDIIPDFIITIESTDLRNRIPITFGWSGSAGNEPSSFYWDFGDGTHSTQENPTHTYQTNGTYTVRLTITDYNGNETTREKHILIQYNKVPVASFYTNASGIIYQNQTILFVFDGIAGDGLTRVYWNFGDGSDIVTGYENITHTYRYPGTYTITLTVIDSDNDTDVYTYTITIEEYVPKKEVPVWVWIIASIGGAGGSFVGIKYYMKQKKEKERQFNIEMCGSEDLIWDGVQCIPKEE